MRERAFPEEPEMHERGIVSSESTYKYYSHSGHPEVVEYRRLTEEWLSHYPEEHLREFLRRFQGNDSQVHEAAFFELFLHNLLRSVTDQIEIEGLIPDSGKHADFVLRLGDYGEIHVEALSLLWPLDSSGENLKRVNQYVSNILSSDFSIWFGDVQGELSHTPPRKPVEDWTRRVLQAFSWEEADRLVRGNPERLISIEPLVLNECQIDARLLVRPPDARTPQSCLGMPATSANIFGYDTRVADTQEKIKTKIKTKKQAVTSTPFVLAVNVNNRMRPYEEKELEVLYGNADNGTGGVWRTSDGRPRETYTRCAAIWFFHQVDLSYPQGRRNALHLHPDINHDERMVILAKAAEARGASPPT